MLNMTVATTPGWPLRVQDPWEGQRTMNHRLLSSRLRQRQRWECTCTTPATLLAIYEPGGLIEIKMRDRVYVTSGCVHATCPRCGVQHVLDLRPASATDRPQAGTTSDPNPAAPTAPPGGWR